VKAAPPTAPSLWPLIIVVAAASVALYQWPRPTRAARSEAPSNERAPVAARPPLECPADQLPDDGVCIPVPPPDEAPSEAPTAIGLLPGRAENYTRYVTPVAAYPAAPAPQGLGLFVAAPRGVPVTAIELEAQAGPTQRRVVPTAPPALLTLHRVERSGATRTYVLAYAGLTFDALPVASDVPVGTPLGRVAPGPGVTGLGLSVRQLRRGVDPDTTPPERLLLDSSSLACDPRNVLPAKPDLPAPKH
jgi:hypothetical protein